MMIPLVAVVGPTASGKTWLAVEIAKKYGGEVVSCDSMQIYKGMDIGTAKPSCDEMQGVPHHMVGIIRPDESYSVARYVKEASDAIMEIRSRGKLPVLAGGTGLYFSSLVNNTVFTETKSDPKLRESLKTFAEKEGGEKLLQILAEFDPETAARLHPNNTGRIIRAIEIYKTSGVTMSQQLEFSRQKPSCYNLCAIGLWFSDRKVLYDKINRRVDAMFAAGLENEVGGLLKDGVKAESTSMQAIGYKELIKYLHGEEGLAAASENIKRETRRYAKRQMTWFRRDPRILWLDRCEYNQNEKICQTAFNLIDKTITM